jgi:hypothetical protein
LKLASLLAEFLKTNQRLDLPGIGSFLPGPTVNPEPDADRQPKNVFSPGIRFEMNPDIKDAPDLVAFIASRTGKIKALAAADLESYLELARQLLNIGKPFVVEGIGTLTKLQAGDYSFTPGSPVTVKASEDTIKKKADTPASANDTLGGFKSILYAPRIKTDKRKTLFIFLLLAGLALALWGGYAVYKRTTGGKKELLSARENRESTGSGNTIKYDTGKIKQDPAIAPAHPGLPAGYYKFVVETTEKTRGLKRYHRLKNFGLAIQMETKDSLRFKLFFMLPAAPADTSRLIDSLRRLYTPAGNSAYVEK